MRYRFLPFIIILCFFSFRNSEGWAGPNEELEKLLSQENRPSISQTIDEGAFASDAVVFYPYNGTDATVLDILTQELPRVIISIERLFPHGSIVAVGRDMDFLGDGIEAYLKLTGQEGRLHRIGMSWNSFKNVDPRLEEKFFKDSGVIDLPRPIVFIDTVNGGGGQMLRFLRFLYDQELKKGRGMKDLVTQINAVGFREEKSSANDHGLRLEAGEKVLEVMGKSPSFDINHFIFPIFTPKSIDDIPLHHIGFRDFSSEWHGKYLPFSQDASGKVTSRPGVPGTVEQRTRVLFLQSMLYRQLVFGNFYERLVKEGQRQKVSIPAKTLPAGPTVDVVQGDKIENILMRVAEPGGLGKPILRWIAQLSYSDGQNLRIHELIEKLPMLVRRKLLTGVDTLNIIKSLLALPSLSDAELQLIKKISEEHPLIQHVLDQKNVFKYSLANKNYQTLMSSACDRLMNTLEGSAP